MKKRQKREEKRLGKSDQRMKKKKKVYLALRGDE